MQLDIRDLAKHYSGGRGLFPTTLAVARGEWIAIIGHNGAGKSTLMQMLATWIPPDGGHVTVDGIDLGDRAAIVRKIGFVPEMPCLFDFFSVEYNLRLFAALFQIPFQRVEEILEEFSLVPFRKAKIQDLSKGLKQRVNIGRGLLADPSLLIFDEPTSGLDFEMTQEIYQLLKVMHLAGKTILFSTHRPEEIKNLATRFLVLHEGRLVFDGSPREYFQSDIHQHLYA